MTTGSSAEGPPVLQDRLFPCPPSPSLSGSAVPVCRRGPLPALSPGRVVARLSTGGGRKLLAPSSLLSYVHPPLLEIHAEVIASARGHQFPRLQHFTGLRVHLNGALSPPQRTGARAPAGTARAFLSLLRLSRRYGDGDGLGLTSSSQGARQPLLSPSESEGNRCRGTG